MESGKKISEKLKKHFSLSNLITVILIVALVYIKFPIFANNIKNEGTKITSREVSLLAHDGKIIFPPEQGKIITIIWATWCGPCSIEMKRLKASVEKGKIPANAIFAIAPFEDASTIKRYLGTHNYPFVFVEAPGIAESIKVNVTPTTLFMENGKIVSMSSGISVLGIFEAEKFISKH